MINPTVLLAISVVLLSCGGLCKSYYYEHKLAEIEKRITALEDNNG